MNRSRAVVLWLILVVGTSVTPLHAQAWIEYAVTGTVQLENREEDVVMCTITDEAFLAHTIGEWNISVESADGSPGEHAAEFMVAAPQSVVALQGPAVDDRLRGEGVITIADGGMGQYGFPRVEVTYEATNLTSENDKAIGIKGKFACDVM